MAVIDPVTTTFASDQTNSTSDSTAADIQNQFLTMLIAQLQYQDPLNPLDNTEFTSQLAQINTVNQLQQANRNLTYHQLYLASINNSQSIGFIGKQVLATGDSVYWDNEHQPEISYTLAEDAASVVVNVYDVNGTLVNTIHGGDQSAGNQKLVWSGTDANGSIMPEGSYRYDVMAVTEDGTTVPVTKMLSGIVDGVTFQDGVTYVTVRGQKIPLGEIVEILSVPESTQDEGSDNEDESEGLGDEILETLGAVGAGALKVAPFLF